MADSHSLLDYATTICLASLTSHSLMLHGTVDVSCCGGSVRAGTCLADSDVQNKLCMREKHLGYLSKFFKFNTRSMCVYGISCFSGRAFLYQREGNAKKRSWSVCMGAFLYKLVCLYRIFKIEDSRYCFIEMLSCRTSEKPLNFVVSRATKTFLS